MFYKKGILRSFVKFTGKHLCQSLFLIKLQPQPVTLLKKRLWHRCFPVNFAIFPRTPFRSATLLKKRLWDMCFLVNFARFLRTPFLTKHLRWLLLELHDKLKLKLYKRKAFPGIVQEIQASWNLISFPLISSLTL